MVLFLSNEDVERVLKHDDLLNCLDDAYREMAYGRAINQQRIDTEVPVDGLEQGRYELKTMAGIIPKLNVAALRFISVLHSHPVQYGKIRDEVIPAALGYGFVGLIILFDLKTTEPIAVFQDGFIRNIRVAGTNALAAKYLAREDASTLGILGSGWMARAHAHAMCGIRHIRTIKLYSPNEQHRTQCAAELEKALGVRVQAVDQARDAVEGVDILMTTTSAKEPIVKGEWLVPGTHVGVVTHCELDAQALERMDVVVIHTRRMFETHLPGGGQFGTTTMGSPTNYEAWDYAAKRLAMEHAPLLEDILTGRAPGRTRPEQVSLFFNVPGLGIQFAAAAARALELAKAAGLGTEVPSELFVQRMRTG